MFSARKKALHHLGRSDDIVGLESFQDLSHQCIVVGEEEESRRYPQGLLLYTLVRDGLIY